MSSLFGVALGALGGFALARAIEARAHGLPVEVALLNWSDPVATLKLDWLARQPLVSVPHPDGVLPPSFRGLRAISSSNDEEED